MFLHVTIILLTFLIGKAASYKCYTCENLDDPDDCHNITERGNNQSCFAIVEVKEKSKTFTLGITDNETITEYCVSRFVSLGCVESHWKSAEGKSVIRFHTTNETNNCGTIPTYSITKVKRDADKKCFECCSKDRCNNRLCQHRKPSKCIDDVNVDCAHMNVMFNICKNVHQAKKICPEFCRLCSLVDGNWAEWSEWSSCDVTCDVGIHIRKRTCTNPAPAYQGQDCVGNHNETKPCNNILCPVNGGWSEWSNWGTCSVTCDTGLKKRNRSCSNPYPQRTGVHCFGDSIDVEICKQRACINVTPTVAFRSDTVADLILRDNKVIVFSTNILNIGEAYNNKTGIFVTPVPGLYQFTAQICMPPNTHSYIGITVKGRALAKSLLGDSVYHKCYTLDTLATVALGDAVSINCMASCDSADKLYRNNHMLSSFSGFLINANIN